MSKESLELVRRAYEAYARGDVETMLGFVDPDLEWTYLDLAFEDPEPQVCHGRHELEHALARQTERGLKTEIEEVVGNGDLVMVVTRTPGVDGYRERAADDRNYDVLTVRDGLVVALRACRDRNEALAISGVGEGR